MKKIFILFAALLSFGFSQAQVRYLKGVLEGSQEVPARATTASGVVIVKYNMATKAIEVHGDFAGLTDTVTDAHLHTGASGVAGPVILPLVHPGIITGTVSGSATFTQAFEDSLLAGKVYANVHSKTYPAGEIRAQLTLTADGQTDYLTSRIQSAQETPPNASPATGAAFALLDRTNREFYLTGSFSGLTAAATAAHVHVGLPGVPGAILFPLVHGDSTAGTLHAVDTLSIIDAIRIDTGAAYVNIHTSTYPAGEVRGQLVNNATLRYLVTELSGANQVPANASTARGTVVAFLNTETHVLRLTGDFQNLKDLVSMAHIHIGAAGTNGDVVVPLNVQGFLTGVISVTDTVTPAFEAEMLAGNTYVNVHNPTFPGGEIRGQLMATTNGETAAFLPILTGAQEVPVNTSTATAPAAVVMDKATRMVYVTGGFSGLSSQVTMGHIHQGPAGVSGPVIFPLSVSGTTIGTISGSGMLSASLIDSMINGLTYLNIHTANFPAGEIRAQLGNLLLPVKLAYVNAFKQRNNVAVIWETTEELNVSRYEVQQLNVTTGAWITKATVPAKGATTLVKYDYSDVPTVFNSDYVIYRLKMIDKDAKATYSSVIKVNFRQTKAELFIQANPVTNGVLKYTITGLAAAAKAEVTIVDYSGKMLVKTIASSLMNNSVDISQLPAGMYRLSVTVNGAVLSKNFIK